jgi:hypothetical protein
MTPNRVRRERRRWGRTKLVMAAVAALAVLAATPAIADLVTSEAKAEASPTCRQAVEDGRNHYGEGEWPCPLGVLEAEEAEREIKAAKERAQAEVEALAARTKALGEPVKYLTVRAVAHPATCRQACEGALRDPGYTTLRITSTPYAYLIARLVRYGHRTEHVELEPGESEWTVRVPWTCGHPGGTYRYTVSAHSNVGETLVRQGAFRPVSAARCRWLKHAVEAERKNNERLAHERERETEREERERLKQWESNCRALGDTPAVLDEEGGILHVCRTPGGYTIEVPE